MCIYICNKFFCDIIKLYKYKMIIINLVLPMIIFFFSDIFIKHLKKFILDWIIK